MVVQPSRQPNPIDRLLMSVEDYLTLERNSPGTSIDVHLPIEALYGKVRF